MHTHCPNGAGLNLVTACLISILAFGCWPGLCNAATPATQEKPKPEAVLDAGTQSDADAATAVMEKFLGLWMERKYEDASALVAEPVRERFVEAMKKRAIELKSIDRVRLFEHDELLLARVDVLVAPSPDRKDLKKQVKMFDMVFRDGKWWVTAR